MCIRFVWGRGGSESLPHLQLGGPFRLCDEVHDALGRPKVRQLDVACPGAKDGPVRFCVSQKLSINVCGQRLTQKITSHSLGTLKSIDLLQGGKECSKLFFKNMSDYVVIMQGYAKSGERMRSKNVQMAVVCIQGGKLHVLLQMSVQNAP